MTNLPNPLPAGTTIVVPRGVRHESPIDTYTLTAINAAIRAEKAERESEWRGLIVHALQNGWTFNRSILRIAWIFTSPDNHVVIDVPTNSLTLPARPDDDATVQRIKEAVK